MGEELDSDRSCGIERFDGNALQMRGQQRLQLWLTVLFPWY